MEFSFFQSILLNHTRNILIRISSTHIHGLGFCRQEASAPIPRYPLRHYHHPRLEGSSTTIAVYHRQFAARHDDDPAIPLLLEGPDAFSADSNNHIYGLLSFAFSTIVPIGAPCPLLRPSSYIFDWLFLIRLALPQQNMVVLRLAGSVLFRSREEKDLWWPSCARHRHCIQITIARHTYLISM